MKRRPRKQFCSWRRLLNRLGAVAVVYKGHSSWHLPLGGQWRGIGWAPPGGRGGGGLPPPIPMHPCLHLPLTHTSNRHTRHLPAWTLISHTTNSLSQTVGSHTTLPLANTSVCHTTLSLAQTSIPHTKSNDCEASPSPPANAQGHGSTSWNGEAVCNWTGQDWTDQVTGPVHLLQESPRTYDAEGLMKRPCSARQPHSHGSHGIGCQSGQGLALPGVTEWQPGLLRLTHSPTHTRNIFLRKKMKFIKGARNWGSI